MKEKGLCSSVSEREHEGRVLSQNTLNSDKPHKHCGKRWLDVTKFCFFYFCTESIRAENIEVNCDNGRQ